MPPGNRLLGRNRTLGCTEAIRNLSEFLDGELGFALAVALARHLGSCRDCRVIVDTTRKTIDFFCATDPPPLPESVHLRLESALAKRWERTRRFTV